MLYKSLKETHPNLTLEILLLFVVIIWGGNYTVIKLGLRQVTPEDFVLLRILGCAILFPLITLIREGNLRIDKKDIPALIITGLVGISLYQTLFTYALSYTTTSNTSLMLALSPLFTALFSYLMGQGKPSNNTLYGILISFIGIFFVIRYGPSQSLAFNLENIKGDILAFLASMAWGIFPILTKDLLIKYSVSKVMSYCFTISIISLLPFTIANLGGINIGEFTPLTWFAVFYNVVFSTIITFSIWYYGVKVVGSTKVMVYMFLVPIFAIVIAFFTIGERISLLQIIGAICVILGIHITKTGKIPLNQEISQLILKKNGRESHQLGKNS